MKALASHFMVLSLPGLIYEMGSLNASPLGGYESSITRHALGEQHVMLGTSTRQRCQAAAVRTSREESEKAQWGHLAGGSSLRGSQGTLRMMPQGKLSWGREEDHSFPTDFSLRYRDPCDGGWGAKNLTSGPRPLGAGKT